MRVGHSAVKLFTIGHHVQRKELLNLLVIDAKLLFLSQTLLSMAVGNGAPKDADSPESTASPTCVSHHRTVGLQPDRAARSAPFRACK